MERLKALTEQLSDMSEVSEEGSDGVMEYKVSCGLAFSRSLKYNDEVAVAQGFFSKDTIFPYHSHPDSEEILVIYSGMVSFVTDIEKRILKPGDSIHIPSGCGHFFTAKTDVKMIIITIPPDAVVMPKMPCNG